MPKTPFRLSPRLRADLIIGPILGTFLGWTLYSVLNCLLDEYAIGLDGFWDTLIDPKMLRLLGLVVFIQVLISLWRRWWYRYKRRRGDSAGQSSV